MKKVYILFVSLGLIFSCSGGGDDDSSGGGESNQAPTVPTQVYPLNNTLCLDNNVRFEWNASTDPDNDGVRYRVQISESSTFNTLTSSVLVNSNTRQIILPIGQSFYWRVKAIDSKQAESAFSSVSQFLTEGEGATNHLPFAPELVAPTFNSEVQGTSTTLSWTAMDFDNDMLTFDIYLGTDSNPTTKVSENQTETSYQASNLSATTTYYFKVVVKDTNGGVTVGQVWSFRTQ